MFPKSEEKALDADISVPDPEMSSNSKPDELEEEAIDREMFPESKEEKSEEEEEALVLESSEEESEEEEALESSVSLESPEEEEEVSSSEDELFPGEVGLKPEVCFDPPGTEDDFPANEYGDIFCKCCQKLQKRKFKPKDDDSEYVGLDEDFNGDEELKLRVIHHRRKKWVTGNFYAHCQPNYSCCGGVFHRDHYWHLGNLDELILASVKFVIWKYHIVEGKSLILGEILNTTMEQYACWWFYVTFTGSEHPGEVQVYQTAVAYYPFSMGGHKVAVFRRKIIGKDDYEDLLPPKIYFVEDALKVKKELMSTLDEEDREVFQLGEKEVS